MAEKKGCLVKTLIGCGGLLAVAILLVIIGSTLAIKQVGNRQDTEPALAPLSAPVASYAPGEFPSLVTGQRGRVVLLLGQGEFSIAPAKVGEGPSAEARYNPEVHEYVESFETLADSSWVYKIGFRRIKSGFGAFLEAIFGDKVDASVKVHLPRNVPFELDVKGESGGMEMELGGLWITDADVRFEKGGIVLSVDEPMQQPMDRLLLRTKMGGVQAEGLGNASPRLLGVNCGMGGANLELDGQWLRDCDARLVVTMGGIAVMVPDDIQVTGLPGEMAGLQEEDPETPVATIRFSVSEKMGEIEIVH